MSNLAAAKVSCPTLFTSSSRQRSLAPQLAVYACTQHDCTTLRPCQGLWLSVSCTAGYCHPHIADPHALTAALCHREQTRPLRSFTISILTYLFKAMLELSLVCVCQAITERLVQLHRARTVGSNTGCRMSMWCVSVCSSVTNRSPRKTQWVLMELTPCSLLVKHQQPLPGATS